MKVVISVIGADQVGIIAAVTSVLAENKVNIVSINQNIVDGIFNMIMICEPQDQEMTIIHLQNELAAIEGKAGVQIKAQRMDIFQSMHKIV